MQNLVGEAPCRPQTPIRKPGNDRHWQNAGSLRACKSNNINSNDDSNNGTGNSNYNSTASNNGSNNHGNNGKNVNPTTLEKFKLSVSQQGITEAKVSTIVDTENPA